MSPELPAALPPDRLPLVSVVMPTFNRAHMLERAVSSLAAQSYPSERYELVVVDDGSTDDTPRIQEGLSQWRGNLRVLRIDHAGSYAARNVGWRQGNGGIVAFTDDDCLADPDWISSMARAFAAHAEALGVQGKTVTIPRLVTPLTHQVVVHRPSRLFQTCNIAYRREALVAAGGFDEQVHHFGDTMLGAAVSALGPVVFAPDMIVVHPPRPRAALTRTEWVQWLKGELRLYRRYPDFYRRTRGPNFVLGVVLHWLIGSPLKHAATHIPWLLRDPDLYVRGIALQIRERTALLAALPAFFWAGRGMGWEPVA